MRLFSTMLEDFGLLDKSSSSLHVGNMNLKVSSIKKCIWKIISTKVFKVDIFCIIIFIKKNEKKIIQLITTKYFLKEAYNY